MNLLIIGAGGHGRVVKEVDEATGKYNKIEFLDDNSSVAIGKCNEYMSFRNDYTYVFVAFGSNELRHNWIEILGETGFKIPTLIHPRAYVSPTAEIELGVVVMPKAVINAKASIKQGSIIGMGSTIDHDVTIEEYCYINTGAIVKANCRVKSYAKIDAGEVFAEKQFNQEYDFETGV